MRGTKAGMRRRVGVLAALAALVTMVAVLPMFGRPAYAAERNLVATAEFIFPGGPTTRLTDKFDIAQQCSVVSPCNLKVRHTILFPSQGQVVVGAEGPDGKDQREIMTYAATKGEVGQPVTAPVAIKSQQKVDDYHTVEVRGEKKNGKTIAEKDVVYWNAPPANDQGFYRVFDTKPRQGAPPPTQSDTFNLLQIDNPCAADTSSLPAKDGRLYEVHCGFVITARGSDKAGTPKKQHDVNTRVKLATQLTNPGGIGDQSGGAGGAAKDGCSQYLETDISGTAAPDLRLTLKNARQCFPATGIITVWTSENVMASLSGVGTEWFRYDLSPTCGGRALGADQLCIRERALQNDNAQYKHPADTCHKPNVPAGTKCKSTQVDLHFQIEVKDPPGNGINDPGTGFLPSGNLMIYNVDAGNNIVNVELLGYNNVLKNEATIKPGGLAKNEFHIVSRGGTAATLKKMAIQAHSTNSIVTAPDTYAFCRARLVNPLPATGSVTPGPNSVGLFPVCYTQSQPNGWPKNQDQKGVPPTYGLNVPLIGDPLILQNALGAPFLSTGPVDFLTLDDLPEVDPDGNKDKLLRLRSACIVDFTPGVNLQATVDLTDDRDSSTPDTGSSTVILDTIHGTGATPGDCDDPAGFGDVTFTYYDAEDNAKDPTDDTDDDTDGDGCTDAAELQSNRNKGGLRDPWNPWDFFDAEQVISPRQITLPNDILLVAGSFGSTTNPQVDRSKVLGPFHWNKDGPDGTVNIPDDILGVAGQFGNRCDNPYP